MPRLPVPDQDANQWGAVLNEFLRVSHRPDGKLQGVIEVFNVRDFGAIGDGVADDGSAIQKAATAIPAAGGILYFPPGVYKIVPHVRSQEPFQVGFEIKSKTWVLGAGHASVLKAAGNLVMLLAQGVTGIRIANLSFVIDVLGSPDNDYTTAIDLEGGASDITVDSCKFEAINVPANDHITLHAVLAKGIKRLWITNNQIYQMQIKTGADASTTGFNVMGPAVIAKNYLYKPRNWGISAVHFTEATEIVDMIITDNLIEDPAGEGGIAVGADSDLSWIESLKRIVIRGNIMQGQWANEGAPSGMKQAIGVLVRAARQSEQILIEGNIIRKDGNEPPLELLGIKIDVCTQPTTMKSLCIAHNTISHTLLPAIQVLGDQELDSFVISGNTLEETGGIEIKRGNIDDGIVIANVVYHGGGLHLKTLREGDQIGSIFVRDNIFKGTPGGSGDGIRLDAFVANTRIGADVFGNRCANYQYGIHEVGADEGGQGVYDLRYFDNDLRGNTIAPLHVTATAILRDNRT